jgi:NADPH:quinone reductase-like Zn-dependent oxidoreductase
MKAIYIRHHGDIDVLEYGDLPDPVPDRGEVLVRLKVAALNNLDLWVRRGWPGIKIKYPFIPGADGAGEVAAIGPDVDYWHVGDRVVLNPNIGCGHCNYCLSGFDNRCRTWGLLGETRDGTYAQYVAVPAGNLYPLPDGFDEKSAAAAALVFQTAWHSLISRGKLKAGESVLIVGASGGVNSASVQIAKLAGAEVYVVASNRKKLDLAEKFGADYLIDRSEEENWSKTVYELTNGTGVDVVVDNVGTTFQQSFRSARKGGRILTVGNTGGAKIEIDNRYIFGKHLSLIGSTMSPKSDFAAVMELLFTGELQAVLDKSYPLSDAHLAQQRLEAGEQMGKLTLLIP